MTDEVGGRGETTGETVEVHDSEGDGEVNVVDDGLSATVKSIGEANAAKETHLAEVDGPDSEAPVDAETLRIARKETQKGQETSKRQKAAFFDVLEACESQRKVADLLSISESRVSERKSEWTNPRPLEDEDEGDDDETPRIYNETISLKLNRQEAFEIVHTAPTDTARRVFDSVLEEVSE